MAEVRFTKDAMDDLVALDGAVLPRVLSKLRLLRDDAEAGQPLGSRKVSNLTGFRKLLVANRQYRIVYRIEKDGSICVVWVIASRTDGEAYKLAAKRLRDGGGGAADQTLLDFADMLERLKPQADGDGEPIDGAAAE